MTATYRSLLLFNLLACSLPLSAADTPLGDISANAEVVRAGTFPTLDWNITYPESIIDWVNIEPNGTIRCTAPVNMQVRNLAADVQSRTTFWNGFRWVTRFSYVEVTCFGRVNNEGWRSLFQGIQPNINPNQVVWNRNMGVNDSVVFAARSSFEGHIWHFTGQSSPNVVLLRRGDVPPDYTTWTTQSTLGEHIDPYLNDEGVIDIGPRDVIIAFELTHIIPNDEGEGDLQDMILLLTFQRQGGN